MKRKIVAPQHGACGVWLDASALKKRKVQTRAPLRDLSQQSPCLPPTRLPLACTKQTTISTFFSALRPGERTSTSQRLPAAVSNSAPFPKGHKLTRLEKQAQDLGFPQPASASAQSNAKWQDVAPEREALAEGKDLLSLDCTLPLQEKEFLAAFSPLRERNIAQDSWWSKKRQLFQAESRHGLLSSWSDGCLMEAAESENVDPQLKGWRTEVRGFNEPAAGLRLRPKGEVCKSSYEERHKESQAELPIPLFSQDSEGRKVISHRFVREQGKLPLQKKPLWNQGSPSADILDTSQQLHYDSLFTEDSEGNRVIKH